MKILQKDIVLEQCSRALAALSRRTQPQAVCRAEGTLAQMHSDILARNARQIDVKGVLDQLRA